MSYGVHAPIMRWATSYWKCAPAGQLSGGQRAVLATWAIGLRLPPEPNTPAARHFREERPGSWQRFATNEVDDMRNYGSSYDLDYNPYAETERGSDALRTVALLGAMALIAAPAIVSFARRWKQQQNVAQSEPAVDKTLKDSFPASDPPASRYFDIPENRL
jgi:hypothetical protein